MWDLRPVLVVIGILLATLGCAELLPAIYDLSIGNPDWMVFATSGAFTLFVGVGMAFATWEHKGPLSVRQAFILTVGAWVAITVFGAIPFVLSSLNLSYTDAYFETMSAITTTGATVIAQLDKAPPGILLWRAELQWLGGLGIIVMAIAILPMLQVGGMQLFRVEAFDTAGKILPRATQISSALILVYVGATGVCALAYYLAGMRLFDAAIHAMTTLATGGMSSHDASLGFYDSALIEAIAIVFMIIGSLPFLLYARAVRGNPAPLFRDSQVRWFFGLLAIFIFLAWTSQATEGHEVGLLEFRDAAFAVVSIMTGTGYVTVDYSQWSLFAVTLFFCITFVGGCSGSTACGVKVFRFQVLFYNVTSRLAALIYPHGVFRPRYNGRPLSERVSTSVLSFFFLFLLSFAVISLALQFYGLDPVTAMSATATAMANVGPGLGGVGPAENFSALPSEVKWLLSFAMLLGRLEIFTLLVFFLPAFWRR